jgi:hypothetical protein
MYAGPFFVGGGVVMLCGVLAAIRIVVRGAVLMTLFPRFRAAPGYQHLAQARAQFDRSFTGFLQCVVVRTAAS